MKGLFVGTELLTISPLAASSAEQTITLAIEHMTCAVCPVTVAKAIERVEGVTQVTVDFATKRAVVRYDDDKATWQTIAGASTNAGYPASLLK